MDPTVIVRFITNSKQINKNLFGLIKAHICKNGTTNKLLDNIVSGNDGNGIEYKFYTVVISQDNIWSKKTGTKEITTTIIPEEIYLFSSEMNLKLIGELSVLYEQNSESKRINIVENKTGSEIINLLKDENFRNEIISTFT